MHHHQVLREILRRVENALADGWIRETSDCATAKRRRRRQRRRGRNEYYDYYYYDDDDDHHHHEQFSSRWHRAGSQNTRRI